MRPFIIAWGVGWIVVGVGAMRSVRVLWRLAYDDPAPSREAIAVAAVRTRRWAFAMMAMGALMGVVSPWL